MMLHKRELLLQLLQHLQLVGVEVCSVGPQVFQVLYISKQCCIKISRSLIKAYYQMHR